MGALYIDDIKSVDGLGAPTANGDTIVTGGANTTFSGNNQFTADLTVTNIIATGTVDGRDLSVDGTKLDLLTVSGAIDLDSIDTRVNQLDSAVVLKGTYDASLGVFPTSTKAGDSWIIAVSGTIDSVDFTINDRLIALVDVASTTIYSGNWHKADYTDTVSSVAGKTGAVTLTSADVGLGNVDNTSDANKPVSIATQTVLDTKLESVVAGTNITVDNTDPKNPIISSTATGSGHIIQDEGTPLTQRDNLNFVGAGVTVTDNAGSNTTVVTISGGGGGSISQTEFTNVTNASEVNVTGSAVISVLKKEAGTTSSEYFNGVEANYTQEDSVNGTDFIGTIVKVHSTGVPVSGSDPFSGSPAQLAGYTFDGDVTDVGGTYNGVATNVTFQSSGYGQEAIFNGSSSKVDVANLAMSTPRFTYSMYLTADTVTSANKLIIDFNTGRAIFSNGVSSPASQNLGYFDGTAWRIFNYALTVGVKTHVLLNVIGGTSNVAELYINGALQDTLAISGVTPSGGCVIGNTIVGSAYFQGKIDEFRIFDGNVSASQALILSNNGSVDFTTTQPYYVFKTAGIDLSLSTEINSYSETSTEPTNTTIKRLVSFDNGVSWVYWNGSSFTSAGGGLADLQTLGNTLAELQTAFTNYILTTEQSVTVAYDLATTDANVSPSVDFATTGFNIDGAGVYTSLTPVTEYTVSQAQTTGSITQKIKNVTGSTQDLLVNYI